MIKLHRCVTVPQARLGWLLLVIGGIAWQMFGQYADWSSFLFLRKQLAQADGIVVDADRTGFTLGDETNGAPIHAVRFEFDDPAGIKRKGTSWTEGRSPKLGEEVTVKYITLQPEINRIVNFRSGPLPLWAGAVLLFPLFGFICILKAVFCRSGQLANSYTAPENGSEPSDATEPGLQGFTNGKSTLPAR